MNPFEVDGITYDVQTVYSRYEGDDYIPAGVVIIPAGVVIQPMVDLKTDDDCMCSRLIEDEGYLCGGQPWYAAHAEPTPWSWL